MRFPLDPATADFLDQIGGLIPPPPPLDSDEAVAEYVRELSAAGSTNLLEGDPESVARVEDRSIAGPGGPIMLRIYRPEGESLPVVVFSHGGAFVLGDIEMHDPGLRHLANAIPAIIVSVDYRTAPADPFPAATDDCYTALRWAAEHCGELGGDPARLVVMGDSAGGSLAAVSAARARDEGGPNIALQVLLYPMVDPTLETASARDFADGYLTTTAFLHLGWHAYLAGNWEKPYTSPAAIDDLSGLPPAVVLTAGYDPLRDEGEQYARRLSNSGVNVTECHYPDQIHGFAFMPVVTPRAPAALSELVATICGALAKGLTC